MNESSRPDPIPLEPIPLEPIDLEPLYPAAQSRTPAPEPALAPLQLELADAPETALPAADSTSDMPALPPPAPVAHTPAPGGGLKLQILRGQRMDVVYPLYPGKNYLGRTDDKPVDIDLEDQEAADRIWTSRQHAVINYENGALTIEDLNSLNGTFVNRTRVHPGQSKELRENDVIQVGTVHLKVVVG